MREQIGHLYEIQPNREIPGNCTLPRVQLPLAQATDRLSQSFNVYRDDYHRIQRLDLKAFDGSSLSPMYLIHSQPEMLPTSTLHPATATGKAKRDTVLETESPRHVLVQRESHDNPFWWIGAALTVIGCLGLFFVNAGGPVQQFHQ